MRLGGAPVGGAVSRWLGGGHVRGGADLSTRADRATVPTAPTAEATVAAAAVPQSASAPPAPAANPAPRTLVVIQLSGGNDGLNSVVPYGNGLYYQLRPQIGIPPTRCSTWTIRSASTPT